MDGVPLPYQASVVGKVEEFGVQAVFGKMTLTAREVLDMTIAKRVMEIAGVIFGGGDWSYYLKLYPKAEETLEWIISQYKDWTNGSVFR